MNRFDTYNLNELTLVAHDGTMIDLKERLMEMAVFSSIFDASMSAHLLVHDSFNLIENAPIVGGETIRFNWITTGRTKPVAIEFKVYKIGRRVVEGMIQGYILYLTTADAYRDENTAISRAFIGGYHECVPKALKAIETSKKVNADPTSGSMATPFLSPNWSPLQICKWMAGRAMDSTGGPVLFFEHEDAYNFRTLDYLYSQEAWSTFVYEPQDAFGYDESRSLHNFSAFEMNGTRNVSAADQRGVFATDLEVYDFATKTIIKKPCSYNTAHIPTIDNHKVEYDEHVERRHRRFIETQPDGSHHGDYQRLVAMNMISHVSGSGIMPADSDMRVGSIIEFDVPSAEPLNNGKRMFEERNSGRFIISSIKVTFTRQHATSGVEICKDSQRKRKG